MSRGRYWRIAIYSALGCLALWVFFPVLPNSRGGSRYSPCAANLQQLAIAAKQYCLDNAGRLPDADKWVDQLAISTWRPSELRCPQDRSRSPVSYAMNRQWSGATASSIADPATTVLFYEADENGGPALRHEGGMFAVYANGSVEFVHGIPPGLGNADTAPHHP